MSSLMMTLQGRVGSDPALINSAAGTQWARFRLACNSGYRDQEGKWVSTNTTWFTCKAWGKFALNIARSLHKGDPVIVQGRLVPSAYSHTDENSGEVSAQADLALHLSHVGIDLLKCCTVNVKIPEEQAAQRGQSDYVAAAFESGGQSLRGATQAVSPNLSQNTDVPDGLVAEIDSVDESNLVGAGEAPF